MKIPRITIEFDRLICESEKAYHFTINGKNIWMPKSLCSNLNIKGKRLMNGKCEQKIILAYKGNTNNIQALYEDIGRL